MKSTITKTFALLAIAATLGLTATPGQAEKAVAIPAPAVDVPNNGKLQTAILAGGCFWGMEAVFEQIKGVKTGNAGFHQDVPTDDVVIEKAVVV